jgi:hypothetical protein
MNVTGLHIGIDYRNTASRLGGCIADAESWRDLFLPICNGGSLRIHEQNATKRNVVEAIKGLVSVCPIGSDRLGVITYSGHGTFRRGNDQSEVDGNDEAICCFDFQQGGLLWDNELATLLNGGQLLFITDCCHSHTLTRAMPVVVDSSLAPPSPRYIPFDQICEGLAQCEINKIVAPAHEHRAKARSIREANDGAIPGVCHLAGCLDSEFSYDASFNGKPNGAMTHFAIEAYKQLPPGSTYQQWIDLLQTKLPDRLGRYPQHPQLTATAAELRRVIVGKEIAKPEPPPVPAAGPGPVDLVVGVWRAKHIEWERA